MRCPSESQPLNSRRALVEAALACFSRFGYEATSVRVVASQARKNRSLISYYFGNKEGLYREVISHLLDGLWAGIPAQAPPPLEPDTCGDPALGRLCRCLQRILPCIDTPAHPLDPAQHAAVRLLAIELWAPRPEVRDLLMERLAPFAREFKECVQEICPDMAEVDCDWWGSIVLGLCFGCAQFAETNRFLWGDRSRTLTPRELADRLATFIHHGLIPPLPRPEWLSPLASIGVTHEI